MELRADSETAADALVDDWSTPATAVVVEDDPHVRGLLADVLESAGFAVAAVDNGEDGVRAVRDLRPLITTVDVNLPGIDGFETVRRIRETSDTFIMVVTALGDEADAVLGLSAGADDYIVKPFRVRELRARINAVMRRARSSRDGWPQSVPADDAAEAELSHLDLRADPATRTVRVGDDDVELTRTEFELLVTLLESGRRVRDKADLALTLRGESASSSGFVSDADKRAVEAHMTNLRRKIGDRAALPRYVETVRGLGYRLTLDPTQETS